MTRSTHGLSTSLSYHSCPSQTTGSTSQLRKSAHSGAITGSSNTTPLTARSHSLQAVSTACSSDSKLMPSASLPRRAADAAASKSLSGSIRDAALTHALHDQCKLPRVEDAIPEASEEEQSYISSQPRSADDHGSVHDPSALHSGARYSSPGAHRAIDSREDSAALPHTQVISFGDHSSSAMSQSVSVGWQANPPAPPVAASAQSSAFGNVASGANSGPNVASSVLDRSVGGGTANSTPARCLSAASEQSATVQLYSAHSAALRKAARSPDADDTVSVDLQHTSGASAGFGAANSRRHVFVGPQSKHGGGVMRRHSSGCPAPLANSTRINTHGAVAPGSHCLHRSNTSAGSQRSLTGAVCEADERSGQDSAALPPVAEGRSRVQVDAAATASFAPDVTSGSSSSLPPALPSAQHVAQPAGKGAAAGTSQQRTGAPDFAALLAEAEAAAVMAGQTRVALLVAASGDAAKQCLKLARARRTVRFDVHLERAPF